MKQSAVEGRNLTGVGTSQGRHRAMQEGMACFPPTSVGSAHAIDGVRVSYARSWDGLGSVPCRMVLRRRLAAGDAQLLLLDKLGERLAFERIGSRLYQALISKHEADRSFSGGPSREQLVEHLEQRLSHLTMLREIIGELGGDASALTPAGALAAITVDGVVKVVVDPRTSLLQSLEAVLIVELIDNDGWELLGALSQQSGHDRLPRLCHDAQRSEQNHLQRIRAWLRVGHNGTMRAAAE